VPAAAVEPPSQSSSLVEFSHTVTAAQQRKDEAFMRQVFDRHCGSQGELSAPALMAALTEVQAPVLASAASSADDIFRRADANLSGAVDFAECQPTLHAWPVPCLLMHFFTRFMRAAQLPDELEMVLEDSDLRVRPEAAAVDASSCS
jgi:hypothetical protein